MAKQKGIIKLEGTLGDITFLRTKDGYQAREKTSVDANRIATDPAFSRTRENNAEFGRAGIAGRILRAAFRPELENAADGRMLSRLIQQMMKVLQQDITNFRGSRTVTNGKLDLLQGFEFNINGKLGGVVFAPYTTTVNRVEGTLEVNFEDFIPAKEIAAPPGTTHFKIITAAAEVDFEAGKSIVGRSDSGLLPWENTSSGVISLSNSITPNSTLPLFLLLGMEFLQEVNGVQYLLNNGSFNSLTLVKVSVA
jgi:hypothetical protein